MNGQNTFSFEVVSSRDAGSCLCPRHPIDLKNVRIPEHEVVVVHVHQAAIQMCREHLAEFGLFVSDMLARSRTIPSASGFALHSILTERARQIHDEGWDAKHDDAHVNGELVAGARCYEEHRPESAPAGPPPSWPFEATHWKPRSLFENLKRAGALYAAERDRCERAMSRVARVMVDVVMGAQHPATALLPAPAEVSALTDRVHQLEQLLGVIRQGIGYTAPELLPLKAERWLEQINGLLPEEGT